MIDNTTNTTPFFQSTKPGSIRLWHWITFLFFLMSIITVIFGSTLFTTRDNIEIVKEEVEHSGGTITLKQARGVAHMYSDKLWMLHKYIGFGLSFLLFWRIGIEVSLSKENKLLKRINNALNIPSSDEKKHYLFVQYGYVFFYLMFFIMALSGLVLAFEDIAWLDSLHKPANTLHGFFQYGIYTYIIFHLIGVIRADMTRYGGIISRMVNGK